MGSGKTKLSKSLAKKTKFKYFEVSTLVKSLLKMKNRKAMVKESLQRKDQDPLWLAEPLKEKLKGYNKWVVAGVREIALLDAIRDLGQPVHVVELKCPDQVRLQRCKDRYKSLADLKKADGIDSYLGIQEVLDTAETTIDTDAPFKATFNTLYSVLQDKEVVR